MNALEPQVRTRLIKLLWMADNPNVFERATAVGKFFELMKQLNLTPEDVLAPPPINQVVQIVKPPPPRSWRDVVTDVLNHCGHLLTEWEGEFLSDIQNRGRALSPRQIEVLTRIVRKTGAEPWTIAP